MYLNHFLSSIRAAIFGLCIADAVGVPAEFTSREVLQQRPILDMTGYGTYHQPKGTWSDDSSMTLCLADSMAETGTIDFEDIMKRFAQWLFEDAYTPFGECFDAGHTTIQAVSRYQHGTPALLCGGTSGSENGNGSLMRILPLLFPLTAQVEGDLWKNDAVMELICSVSGLTHRHIISKSACCIYLSIAQQLLKGASLEEAAETGINGALSWFSEPLPCWDRIRDLAAFRQLPVEEIRSTGFVVHTLEAALWCLLNTHDYRSCTLKAVNLGSDTDTTAAVAGGLAGLLYGLEGIPAGWKEGLVRSDFIDDICCRLAEADVRLPGC